MLYQPGLRMGGGRGSDPNDQISVQKLKKFARLEQNVKVPKGLPKVTFTFKTYFAPLFGLFIFLSFPEIRAANPDHATFKEHLQRFQASSWRHQRGEEVLSELEISALCASMLKAAIKHLDANSTAQFRKGSYRIQFLNQGRNPINRFAKQAREKAYAETVYDPRYFFHHPWSKGHYRHSPTEKVIIVGHDTIVDPSADSHVLHHEMVHATNWAEFYRGKTSPIYGLLRLDQLGGEGVVALDEMTAYAHDIKVAVKQLAALAQTSPNIDQARFSKLLVESKKHRPQIVNLSPVEDAFFRVARKSFFGRNHTDPLGIAIPLVDKALQESKVVHQSEDNGYFRYGISFEQAEAAGSLSFPSLVQEVNPRRFFQNLFSQSQELLSEYRHFWNKLDRQLGKVANCEFRDPCLKAIGDLPTDPTQ